MAQAQCNNHGLVEAVWKEGEKNGRKYAFWGCPKSEKDQYGNWIKCKVQVANTPDGKFNQGLDKSAAQMDNHTKDDTITRLAIVKSLIEADIKPGLDAAKAFVWWLAVVKDTNPLIKGMRVDETVGVAEAIKKSEMLPEEESVDLNSIPF